MNFDWLPEALRQPAPAGSRDYVTVVRTARPCGKRFSLDASGKVTKATAGDVIEGLALTVHVPDAEAMAALLRLLPANHYLIPDFIPETGLIPFEIMAQTNLAALLGGKEEATGLHKIDGHDHPVCAKLKVNFTPGSWKPFDCDRDDHTPAALRNLPVHAVIARLAEAIPGLQGCARVVALSSSGRVRKDGQAVAASPNFHAWVQVADPDLTDQFRVRLMPRLAAAGLGWLKPRGDKLGPAALIDTSVWAISRCVYAGAPAVGTGLTLADAEVLVVKGGRFALSSLPEPTEADCAAMKDVFGIEGHDSGGGAGFRDTSGQLTKDTALDVRGHKTLTLAEFLVDERFKAGEKYRCQSPFRDSTSWNGILHKYADGSASVFDNGTGVLYCWPNPLDGFDDEARGGSGDALEEAVARLAKLATLRYDRVRTAEAKQLGVRAATLDDAVAAAQKRMGLGAADEDGRQGLPIEFEEVEPWPSPVDGAQLLNKMVEACKRVVMLPPHAAEAIALWVVFTYVLEAADAAPLLVISSPLMRCGKTTLIEVLEQLVHRPHATNSITAPALFRVIALHSPCLLFDEVDALLESDKTGDIRSIINAGHTRTTAFVTRTVGEDFEPRRFPVWGPKLLALIGTLEKQWRTVADRAVVIPLQRKPASLKLTKLRRAGIDFGQLRRKTARWTADCVEALRTAEPSMPEGLNDRQSDGWRILLAIADAAGGAWPVKAREAALALSGDDPGVSAVTDGVSVRLLSDIRAIFSEVGGDRITTSELIQKLVAIDDPEAPWAEWNPRGGWDKEIKPHHVAKLLRLFGIGPVSVRLPEGSKPETAKGYKRKSFEEAFASYLR
jgi:putative DNA primase/helicase